MEEQQTRITSKQKEQYFLHPKRSSPRHVPQRRRCHRAPEQQQGEGVRVQQQRGGQTFQGVERQQTKGLFTQVQTGIKIPEQGTREGEEKQR